MCEAMSKWFVQFCAETLPAHDTCSVVIILAGALHKGPPVDITHIAARVDVRATINESE